MKFEDLEKLIAELSVSSKKSVEEITQELADFSAVKYGSITTEQEKSIIKLVQDKLIKGLYRMSNHSYVTSRPDYKSQFGFDDLEMEYLKKAANELGDLEMLEGNENYTKLTKSGILKAKELLGEI
jgi:hypothetical protein